MLLLILTSYLFVQGPRLWAWIIFFVPLGYSPFSTVKPRSNDPGFSRFPKKGYEEGNYA